MYQFLLARKTQDGGFCMHEDGESDVRGTYTALAIASHLNLLTDELIANTANYIASCQTFEGGFGGEKENEAHGGYAYCALASLLILNACDRINLSSLEYWMIKRQLRLEGGFSGRANKLVDSCYSFWVGGMGGLFTLVKRQVENKTSGILKNVLTASIDDHPNVYFNSECLKRYILVCCQDSRGGLLDKPGKPRDYYHTAYALSGLSLCSTDLVKRTNVVFNVETSKVIQARSYFYVGKDY